MEGQNRCKSIIALVALTLVLAWPAVGLAVPRQSQSIPNAEAGIATRRVEARYPDEARLLGVSGFVTVQVIVDAQGRVESAEAIAGPGQLRKASEEAAMHWRFKPAIRSGVAIRSTARISFHFELRASAVNRGETQPRGLTVSAGSPTYRYSPSEKKSLERRLKTSPALTMPFTRSPQSPLEIASAHVRYIRDAGWASDERDTYFMQARIELVNEGDDRTTSAGLQFLNPVTHSVFYVYPDHLKIRRGKHKTFTIKFMTLREDPSALSVTLVGAEFANGVVWGAFPFPPEPAPARIADAERPIDVPPVVLARSLPTYTEDARANNILGAVGLRVLVSSEGHVEQVKITNPLPDGLTQEAIRSVRESLFKPALSKGEPASCWLSLTVEFKSR